MSDNDYMDPILERKEHEAANREERRREEHQHGGNKEARIEAEEKAQLYGPFKAQYVTWFVIALAVAFLLLIVGAYFWK